MWLPTCVFGSPVLEKAPMKEWRQVWGSGMMPTACKVKALYLFCEDSEGNSADEEEDGKMLALLGEKVAWGGPAGRWSWEAWSEQKQEVAQRH